MKCKNRVVVFLVCFLFPMSLMASTIATVNGKNIDKDAVDEMVAVMVKNGEVDTVDLRERIKQNLIDKELILQESFRLKLDQQKVFQENLKRVMKDLLLKAFLEDVLKKNAFKESDIRKVYDDLKFKLMGSKDIQLRHIVVKTEAEAKKLIDLLKKDTTQNFEKLARSKSIDPQAKKNGGDMGILNSKVMEVRFPALSGILLPLGKGAIAPLPVNSATGWHIFKIEDIREVRIPTYDELKPQILGDLQDKAIKKILAELRAKAKIE